MTASHHFSGYAGLVVVLLTPAFYLPHGHCFLVNYWHFSSLTSLPNAGVYRESLHSRAACFWASYAVDWQAKCNFHYLCACVFFLFKGPSRDGDSSLPIDASNQQALLNRVSTPPHPIIVPHLTQVNDFPTRRAVFLKRGLIQWALAFFCTLISKKQYLEMVLLYHFVLYSSPICMIPASSKSSI